jgi:DNA repair protein RecO (recombination protein O)
LVSLDEAAEADNNFHLVFLLGLSKYLGFFPASGSKNGDEYFDLKEGEFTGELPAHSHFISQPRSSMMKRLLNGETEARISRADRNFLLEKILLYYRLHLHDFKKINSHHVLHEVLENSTVR